MNVSFKDNYAPQGIAQLVLAAALVAAPWAFDFMPLTAASRNCWLVAVALAALALASVFAFVAWEEWASGVLGLWLVVSPWVLGFAGMQAALWTHIVVGVLVIIVSVAALLHWPQTPQAPHGV
jgi:hypothetical protein